MRTLNKVDRESYLLYNTDIKQRLSLKSLDSLTTMKMNKTFKIVTGLAFLASCALFATSLVFAQNNTPSQCLGAIVAVRESALDSAMTTYTEAVSNAYAARATALAAAYAQTTSNKAIHNSVKSAWSTFTQSMKDARTTWRSARNGAWSAFGASAKSCKATQSISDADHSIQEASGN